MKKNTRCGIIWLFAYCFLFSYSSLVIGDTFVVTTTNDSGAGSLRQAILSANSQSGADTIMFNIPTTDVGHNSEMGTWRIQPTSDFPTISRDNIVIDGFTQAIFIGGDPNSFGPEIVVDGNNIDATGFYISGSNNELKGLAIHRFNFDPIIIVGDSNRVVGCYIGTDATGEQRFENQHSGIGVYGGSYNVIGGLAETDRNVISGNNYNGITLSSNTHYNQIIGNYLGVSSSGSDTLGNFAGIRISGESRHNTIGPLNVISGNFSGVIFQQNSDSNIVVGNFIGTNPNGTMAWGNKQEGIFITGGSSYNIIGGRSPEERNIISGNASMGITIMKDSDYNQVIGNYIGTDVTGNNALGNADGGITIGSGAKYNMIGGLNDGEGNVISSNMRYGIKIYFEGSEENTIMGNYIGTNADGTTALANENYGIGIHYNAKNNIVGPGNIIAFNEQGGILIRDNAIGNTITRNSIHSNRGPGINNEAGGNNELPPPTITGIGSVWGTAPANTTVEIFSSSDDEGMNYEATVTADAAGNFFWAGSARGPLVTATATDTTGNTSEFSAGWFLGNIIVTSTADTGKGSLRWAIEQANTSPKADSIIFNIPPEDPGFDGTIWRIKPTSILPVLTDSGTVINGYSQTINRGETNLDGPEIMLDGSNVKDNYRIGLRLNSANLIVSGLIISGFREIGIDIFSDRAHDNWIRDNYIGTNVSGSDTLSNGHGIVIRNGAKNNIIGGTESDDRNLISGNRYSGIIIYSDSNIVVGNFVGVDASGTVSLGNQNDGIVLGNGAEENIIGGESAEKANIISGNFYNGINIYGEENKNNYIMGNYIGTNKEGAPLANQFKGVYIFLGANHNQIGPNNIIRYNGHEGIAVNLATSRYNRITQNSISDNQGKGIILQNGANGGVSAPVITSEDPITGTAFPFAIVEIFSDSSDQGRVYEGSVVSDGSGNFSWTGSPVGPHVTATATDDSGNTSGFSVELILVAVEQRSLIKIPETYYLAQNYPNPFNPKTTIQFNVKEKSHVKLYIFDIQGVVVATLADGFYQPGLYKAIFDGSKLASAIYFYRIQMKSYTATRKMMLLK